MEKEKEKDEGDENGGIAFEAKKFSCQRTKEGIILKEIHKHGERQLELSIEESRWIADGLLDRNRRFGEFKRKETRDFGRRSVSLIEGGNRFGCFLSVQLRMGCGKLLYLVVPAGFKGINWGKLASFIRRVTGKPGNPHLENSSYSTGMESSEQRRHYQGRSFAEVVMDDSGDEGAAPKGREILSNEDLIKRIEVLEEEIAAIRWQLLPEVARKEYQANPNVVRKMIKGRQIVVDPTPRINLHFTESVPAMTASDETLSDVLPVHTDSPDKVDISVKALQMSDSQFDSIVDRNLNAIWEEFCTDPVFQSFANNLDCFQVIKRVCGTTIKEIMDTRTIGNDEGNREDGKPSEGDNYESSKIRCIPTEDSGDSDKLSENDDGTEIEWDDVEESFIHIASGMRYCPKHKYYFSWVSHDNDDLRMLYYKFVEGALTLAQDGRRGKKNKVVMEDQDWDRSFVINENSKGYHPNMEELFIVALNKNDNDQSSM